MKKLGCASCGGTMKKMSKGGTTKNVNISKPGAGYAKRTVGGDNQKMNMYGIAQTGQGQMDGKTGVMKKGGSVKKEHPITAFRKANEARQAVVKKSLPKAQDGRITDTTKYRPWDSPNIKPAPYMDPRETLRLEQLKLEQKERLKGNQDNYKINKSTGKMGYTGPKSTVKKLGGAVKSKKKK